MHHEHYSLPAAYLTQQAHSGGRSLAAAEGCDGSRPRGGSHWVAPWLLRALVDGIMRYRPRASAHLRSARSGRREGAKLSYRPSSARPLRGGRPQPCQCQAPITPGSAAVRVLGGLVGDRPKRRANRGASELPTALKTTRMVLTNAVDAKEERMKVSLRRDRYLLGRTPRRAAHGQQSAILWNARPQSPCSAL